jgi:signal transduction histidine kinase
VDYSIQAKARSTLNTNSGRELDADQDGLPDGPFDVFPQGHPFLVEPDESDRRLISLPRISDEPFGYSLGISLIFEEARSQQQLHLAYYDEEGNLLGFVELLEGPAYGQAILRSVFFGLVLAGALSILLAGAAGLWFSHRLSRPILALSKSSARIANGEYASRVEIDRQDELGLLAKTFNRMAEKVDGTVSTLRRFVSDAAHELNTPLTALRTNLDLAKNERKASLRKKDLEQAIEQSERLERLSNALLDISRLEAKMNLQDTVRLDLVRLLREVSERCASRAEQSAIEFHLELPADSVELMGSETQMRRALENLLDNALKFTPQGGEIRIGLRREEDFAAIWVEDTGIGVPKTNCQIYFNVFTGPATHTVFPAAAWDRSSRNDRRGTRRLDPCGKPGTRNSLHLPTACRTLNPPRKVKRH